MIKERVTRRSFLAGAAASALLSGRGTGVSAQSSDLTELTIVEASRRIASRQLSPVEMTRAYLDRIERLNPRINAYITVTADAALKQAREMEDELKAGRHRGPLHGIPIALKDNIDTAGIRTTAASALFAERVPAEDAVVVRKLREAGAVFLGKLNMHEFAFGGTSAITHFGPVHNPWDVAYVPGGSSGGSAAAVAARLCPGALGTDTAASIRMPAAFCGIVGLKGTHGLASIRGIIPLSESHDHVGPLCRTVADSALLITALAGFDPLDPYSIPADSVNHSTAIGRPVSSYRIGIPREPFFSDLDPTTGCPSCVEGRDELSGWGRLDAAAAIAALDAPLPLRDRYEANDDAGPRAYKVSGSNRLINATVDFWDDQDDVYAVPLRKGQRVYVGLTGADVTADLSLALWLPPTRSIDGVASVRFRARISAKPAAREYFSHKAVAAGTYYVQVRMSSPGITRYRLRIVKG